MKLLVLGGTRFLGRHLVEAALVRGHEPTLFNRGRTGAVPVAEVEQLRGEREGDLAPLRGRSWDAVVDTCGYLPRIVRRSAQALQDTVGRYLFVSSISVYADSSTAGQDEQAPPSPDYPVQFIDARDLAAWALDLLEQGRSGAFNASGPAKPLTFGAFLTDCRRALDSRAEFVWPAADFLDRHGVEPWTHLPLYAGDDGRGLNEVSLVRALSAGLRLRPTGETCVDTARWADGSSLPDGIGLAAERETTLIRAWQAQ